MTLLKYLTHLTDYLVTFGKIDTLPSRLLILTQVPDLDPVLVSI